MSARKKKTEKKAAASDGRRTIATNRRARFEYEILDHVETGIVLFGPEVKSLREGRANLGDAYATVKRGELFLEKLHISPYEPATRANTDPMRERKLLAHRREIQRLHDRVREKGFTLVPLSLYFDENGRVKVDLAVVRGKHLYDKRETIKRREADRDAKRSMRRGGRG
ncbi:MAG: SsrA-binding protein SmpB [Myxococcota bacterium]|jgi:SsrA-binding protein|nr:SsrA-binding protein SmpB [Myxococcota bacterium]